MRLLAVLAVVWPLGAQALSAGLRVGAGNAAMAPVRPPAERSSLTQIVGPAVEIRVWRGIGFGIELLIRNSDLSVAPDGVRARVRQLELPLTVAYYSSRPGRPFLRAGMALNRVAVGGGAAECGRGPFGEQFYCLDGRPAVEVRHRSVPGVVVGGGLRLRRWRTWIEPELRFGHWADRNFGVRDAAARSELNQAAILVGILF